MAKIVSRESLRHDDIKVQYYTGLPSYEILEIVLEFVTDGLPDSFAASSCNVFDQFPCGFYASSAECRNTRFRLSI